MTGLLLLSVLLQLVAVGLAIRLFFFTNRKAAWLFISCAILLMAVRRLITLGRILDGQAGIPGDFTAEAVALTISVLMVVGIYRIGPIFAALRKSEEESRREASDLKSTYEEFPDLIFRLAPDGTFLKYHALDQEDLYVPPEGFLGKKPSDVLPADVVEKLNQAIAEIKTGRTESVYDYRLPSPKGTLDFEARVSRLPNGDYRVIVRNITDRKTLEEELEESERRFGALFEQSHLPTIRLRPDGSILQVNPAGAKIWGLSPEAEDFLLRHYNVHEDAYLRETGLYEYVQKAFRGEMAEIPPHFYRPQLPPETRSDGAPPGKWIQAALSPIKDERGNLVEVLATYEDLTERMEAQKAFQKSEERYKAIFENAAVGVALAETKGGKFITANGKFREIFGIGPEEINDLTMGEFTPPEDASRDLETVANVLNEQATVRFKSEKRYLRRDGTPIWADVGLSFIWDEGDGNDVHVIVVEDVTVRKMTENLRRETEERYRATFENAAVGVALCETGTGSIIQANKKFCEILGIEVSEAPGLTMLNFTHPDDLEEDLRIVGNIIEERKSEFIRTEKRYLRKDGSTFWASFAISLIWGKDDDSDLHIIVLDDVTYRVQAETALRDREAKYRAIYDNAAMGVALLDTHTGRILQANQKFCEIYGYDLHEIQGRTMLDFTHPDYIEGNLKSAQQFISNRKSQAFENEQRFVRRDGSLGWAEYTISFIGGEQDEPDLHIIIVEDVTARKVAERDLQESEEKHRLLVESTNVIFWEADPLTWNFIFVSPQAEGILGYPVTDWYTPQFWPKHVYPDDRDRAVRFCQDHTNRLEDHDFEYRMVTSDGSVVWLKDNVSVISEGDKPILMRGVMIDITEIKRAEEERARLGTAIEQACELVVITDPGLRIQYVNPTFTEITGYTLSEVAGNKPDDMLHDPKRDSTLHRVFKKSLESGNTWRGQVAASRRSGESALIDLTVSPVRDASGRTVNYVYIGRDITRETELEALLRQAQKMEAVGQLAGGIAHDFNNILQAIQGYTDITRQDLPVGSELRSNLDEVSKASQRASALVRQLLTFSRRDHREPKIIDLNESISGLIKMLRRVIGEQIDLNLRLVPKLRTIYADPGQVEQILMNLCVNARDAMPEGGSISIETQNAEFEESFLETFAWAREGDYIRLRVSDTGSGIPSEYLDRVFEPFFTTKEVGKGTGLGLATVYGIVKQHEGHIDVQSEPGKGTVFTIYLPAEKSRSQKETSDRRQEPTVGGHETILVAEDDTLVRNLAVQLLERAGYDVIVARDGEEALALFLRYTDRIDLALLDMVMPKMNGNALYARMRERRPDLPVLFSSGYSFGALESEADLGDFVDRIQKPFEPDIMLRKTRELLDLARSAPA